MNIYLHEDYNVLLLCDKCHFKSSTLLAVLFWIQYIDTNVVFDVGLTAAGVLFKHGTSCRAVAVLANELAD